MFSYIYEIFFGPYGIVLIMVDEIVFNKAQRKSIEKMREIKLSYFASKTEEDE